MDKCDNLQLMAEDILNAITVIYGLFKLCRASPEAQKRVDNEVNKIVGALKENILLKTTKKNRLGG